MVLINFYQCPLLQMHFIKFTFTKRLVESYGQRYLHVPYRSNNFGNLRLAKEKNIKMMSKFARLTKAWLEDHTHSQYRKFHSTRPDILWHFWHKVEIFRFSWTGSRDAFKCCNFLPGSNPINFTIFNVIWQW